MAAATARHHRHITPLAFMPDFVPGQALTGRRNEAMDWLLAVVWFVSLFGGLFAIALWLRPRVPSWVSYVVYTMFLMVEGGWFGAMAYDPKKAGSMVGFAVGGAIAGLLLGAWFSAADALRERSRAKVRRRRGW